MLNVELMFFLLSGEYTRKMLGENSLRDMLYSLLKSKNYCQSRHQQEAHQISCLLYILYTYCVICFDVRVGRVFTIDLSSRNFQTNMQFLQIEN